MHILFIVNDVETESERATTIVLATAASRRGHQVHLAGVRDLEYLADGHVGAWARPGPGSEVESQAGFVEAIRAHAEPELITTPDVDVMWLRYNPTEEVGDRAWVRSSPMLFGQLALEHGVVVLNHPYSLSWATSKMYFQQFPEAVRPPTIITRSYERVAAFHREHDRKIVVKPLMGHGGSDVFLVAEDAENLPQIVESITRRSYLIAQPFLADATRGDTRLFLMNGKPLIADGMYAAFRRTAAEDDFRSNMSAGAEAVPVEVDDRVLSLARMVGPKLAKDGIFLAGLDIVGDRLVEINTISAGGLSIAGRILDRNFGVPVIEAVERKVFYKRHYGEHIRNIELATLD